jgi:hypothetical protein
MVGQRQETDSSVAGRVARSRDEHRWHELDPRRRGLAGGPGGRVQRPIP